jgi:hypothetical protein
VNSCSAMCEIGFCDYATLHTRLASAAGSQPTRAGVSRLIKTEDQMNTEQQEVVPRISQLYRGKQGNIVYYRESGVVKGEEGVQG